jgi:uncharacterized protein YjiS (DUF1127 family)
MIRSIIMYFRQKSIYRETYKQLSSLSTKELEDIGITGNMISELANEAAYGKGRGRVV